MAALSGCVGLESLDDRLFDAQVEVIRAWRADRPEGAGVDILIVGIDESTLQRAGVPIALIHGLLGQALEVISSAGARAIAVDLVLPDRSFDRLSPGSDAALIRGLSRAAHRAPLVFVLEPDAGGHLRVPFAPFAAVVGEHGLVTAQLPVDPDGVVRRFDPQLTAPGLRTLAGEISVRLGRTASAAARGWIDYTRGAAFSYVPLIDVAEAAGSDHGAALRKRFEGKVVVIGSVLPYVDRAAQPVSLLAWEYPATAPPSVVIHAQLLRCVLGAGLIRAVPGWLVAGLALALAVIGWMPPVSWRWVALGLASVAGLVVATLLHAAGWRLGVSAPILSGLIAGQGTRMVRLKAGHLRDLFARVLPFETGKLSAWIAGPFRIFHHLPKAFQTRVTLAVKYKWRRRKVRKQTEFIPLGKNYFARSSLLRQDLPAGFLRIDYRSPPVRRITRITRWLLRAH